MCGLGLVFGPNISRIVGSSTRRDTGLFCSGLRMSPNGVPDKQLLRGPGRVGLDEHPAVEPGDRVDTQATVGMLAKLVAGQQFLTHRVPEVVSQDVCVPDTQVM